MRKLLVLLVMMVMLAGCAEATIEKTDKDILDTGKEVAGEVSETEAKDDGDAAEVGADPAPTEDESEPVTTETGVSDPQVSIVMDFVATCINGDDREAKESFMDNNASPDVAALLTLSCLAFDVTGFENPKVTASADYPFDDGAIGNIHLLGGDQSEMIILFRNGKLGWIFEQGKDGFEEMKGYFN